MEVTEKKCTKCGEMKTFACFDKLKAGKYGLKAECKECAKARVNADRATKKVVAAASIPVVAKTPYDILKEVVMHSLDSLDKTQGMKELTAELMDKLIIANVFNKTQVDDAIAVKIIETDEYYPNTFYCLINDITKTYTMCMGNNVIETKGKIPGNIRIVEHTDEIEKWLIAKKYKHIIIEIARKPRTTPVELTKDVNESEKVFVSPPVKIVSYLNYALKAHQIDKDKTYMEVRPMLKLYRTKVEGYKSKVHLDMDSGLYVLDVDNTPVGIIEEVKRMFECGDNWVPSANASEPVEEKPKQLNRAKAISFARQQPRLEKLGEADPSKTYIIVDWDVLRYREHTGDEIIKMYKDGVDMSCDIYEFSRIFDLLVEHEILTQ